MYSFTRTWRPGPTRHNEDISRQNRASEMGFRRFRRQLEAVAPLSPFVPASHHEWLQHRVRVLEAQQAAARRKLAATPKRAVEKSITEQDGVDMRCFGGKKMEKGNGWGAVCCLGTAWTPKEEDEGQSWVWPREFHELAQEMRARAPKEGELRWSVTIFEDEAAQLLGSGLLAELDASN
ncbi:MAG: hypothetical protein Q9159_004471 [Coniocarpon cinnabarinum]